MHPSRCSQADVLADPFAFLQIVSLVDGCMILLIVLHIMCNFVKGILSLDVKRGNYEREYLLQMRKREQLGG